MYKFWVLTMLFFSILVIISKNTVHSLLYLLAVFVIASIYLASWKVDFIALLLIIVYVGAVAVLFSFLVMMVNQRWKNSDKTLFDFINKFFFFVSTLAVFFIFIFKLENFFPTFLKMNENALNLIGSPAFNFDIYSFQYTIDYFYLLYTQYSYLFILVGFVLLVSMICAIILSLNSLKKDLF
jgi:NADH-quinone oxidoreductase subunit J